MEFHSIYVSVNTKAKKALAAYCAENASISSYPLMYGKKCVDILSPIEEITCSISAELASMLTNEVYMGTHLNQVNVGA